MDSIVQDIKSGKPQYELEYKYYRRVRSSKSPARDAAFRLLYLILTAHFQSEVADSQKVYNAVLFVVSHFAIFKYRTRKVVRAAYDDRFQPTEKQRASLDQWPALEPGMNGRRTEDDVTTDSSSSDEPDWDDY